MADKKRLIYAEDLFEPVDFTVFQVGGRGGGKTMAMYEQLFRKRVELAPTIDAVEVVHGHWEDEYGGKYANPRYRCSVCKEKALFKFERDLLGNYKEVQALTPCCPYCMAKLDEQVSLEDIVDLDGLTKANNEAMRKVIDFMAGERREDNATG